jgi:hypothetical protein
MGAALIEDVKLEARIMRAMDGLEIISTGQ